MNPVKTIRSKKFELSLEYDSCDPTIYGDDLEGYAMSPSDLIKYRKRFESGELICCSVCVRELCECCGQPKEDVLDGLSGVHASGLDEAIGSYLKHYAPKEVAESFEVEQ